MRAREHYITEDWVLYLQCSICKEFKTEAEFNKSKRNFLWLQPKCKNCQHTKNKEHYENNRQSYIENAKRRRLKNPERRNELEKKRRDNSSEAIKEIRRKRREKREALYWFDPTILNWKANHYIKKYSLRPQVCPVCGAEGKIEFHHTDVLKEDCWHIWVFCCKHCHEKIHTWEIMCPTPVDLFSLITDN